MSENHHTCYVCGDQRPAEEVEALADEAGLATYECKCGKMLYVRYAWGSPRRAPATTAPTAIKKHGPYKKKVKP